MKSKPKERTPECEVCGAWAYPGPLCKKCQEASRNAREAREAHARYRRWPEANPWRSARW